MGWRRGLLVTAGVLLALIAGNTGRTPLVAQDDEDPSAREHQIKAAYLYQFGRYVEWPTSSFANSKSPFAIGVMAKDPLVPNLEQIARVKKIQDRPIRIRQFSSVARIRACHIVYLPASLDADAQTEAIRKTARKGVLLVGDTESFLDKGGTMQFVVEDNRIRLVISRKAAERAGLTISSKLLQVARVVD
jgi:hypothetical protein